MSAKQFARDSRVRFAAMCVAAAVVYLLIGLSRHDTPLAIGGTAVMIGYAAVLLGFRRRAEPLALLSGQEADERQAQVLLRASAVSGQLLACVLVAGMLITLTTGSDYAGMFCNLCAVGGVTFIAATVWYSRRG